MPAKPRLRRTRFDPIRECECDMRQIVNAMPSLRTATSTVQKLLERQRIGQTINEADLARARLDKRQLTADIRGHWERLHNRMDREREERRKAIAARDRTDRVRNIDIERRTDHGVAANP